MSSPFFCLNASDQASTSAQRRPKTYWLSSHVSFLKFSPITKAFTNSTVPLNSWNSRALPLLWCCLLYWARSLNWLTLTRLWIWPWSASTKSSSRLGRARYNWGEWCYRKSMRSFCFLLTNNICCSIRWCVSTLVISKIMASLTLLKMLANKL